MVSMSNRWPIAKLGEVIKQRKEFFRIDDLKKYKRCRVQLHAQGIVLRDEVEGAAVKTKDQQVCRADEFLVAEIDAKVGGFGMVPQELDGAIVSSHYFLFTVDTAKLDHRFLGYYVKTPMFRDQVEAQGSTNYAAIRPTNVLGYSIPLPPLSEQRRIVTKIESLATKIEEARDLMTRTSAELGRLFVGIHLSLSGNRRVRLRDILLLDEQHDPVEPGRQYKQIGVKGFGGGLFAKPAVAAGETTYRHFNKLYSGAVVLSQVKGWEGAISVCTQAFAGCYASPEYRTFRCCPGEALPEYISGLVQTPWFHRYLVDATRGVGARRERIRPELFLAIDIPMPTAEKQAVAVRWLDRLESLRQLRAKATPKLDALLASILDKAFRGELVEAGPAVAGEATTVGTLALFPDTVQAMEDAYATDLAVAVLTLNDRTQRGHEAREFHQQKADWFAKVVLRLPIVSTFDAQVAGPWSQHLRQALEGRPAREKWFTLHHRPGKRGDVVQPGPNLVAGVQWANTVLGDSAGRVRSLLMEISDFGDAKLELWATVLKVAEDLLAAGKPISRQAIQHGIDTWPGKRAKGWFTRHDVDNAFDTLTAKGWLKRIRNE